MVCARDVGALIPVNRGSRKKGRVTREREEELWYRLRRVSTREKRERERDVKYGLQLRATRSARGENNTP